ncbi:bifunctional alpha/beta hydrolase/OsmC family protein [Aquimarina algicola]|uniref:OsmC family protein n=1 Tax=Aquimarina algicola TaxID=2589995 RepID=A0A504J2K2_9FLAO|nr:bifunctional alpha/beta hydrolase/OsmC family protein [Aquimarina algicola]TPN85146.1 OsmC family protein [Aquimarina algicola]
MSVSKVTFTNTQGQVLSGRLELPANQHPHNFALFAHCFTCNKNLGAVRNISRGLTSQGFGVLRFDFTGLGESEGDFEDTNFSGNVEDLIAAANFLTEQYDAPTLLIGHSLGGAASIFAASEIDSIKAVATIGAPSNPKHVKHLLKSGIDEIEASGQAIINLSGRDFTIKKQFLDDLETKSLPEVAKNLGKALLVMHSPQDTTVGIKNAEEIYISAKHPKSFITLDGADHLLMKKEDSIYAGKVIAEWSSRYVNVPEEPKLRSKSDVVASLDNIKGYTTNMKLGDHFMVADEPEDLGGNNFGPTPYEYLSAGLASCTAITVKMYAERKGWDLQNIEVHTNYDKRHKEDCDNCEDPSAKIDTFERKIKLEGNLDEKQRKRMLQIADKCPVHRTLHSETQVITMLIE